MYADPGYLNTFQVVFPVFYSIWDGSISGHLYYGVAQE